MTPYHYVSPNFEFVQADHCFPLMRHSLQQPFIMPNGKLSKQSPHIHSWDTRWPQIGFISKDEAHILFNSALRFEGKAALEIGCHTGYSTWHLLAGGVELDVIDPCLRIGEITEHLEASLIQYRGMFNLHPTWSPLGVHELKRKWSLFFIDGMHDYPHPLYDTIACLECAEDDAMMLFHDGWNGGVLSALSFLKNFDGWKVRVYDTTSLVGVAWRGNVEPVDHIPDPAIVEIGMMNVVPKDLRVD